MILIIPTDQPSFKEAYFSRWSIAIAAHPKAKFLVLIEHAPSAPLTQSFMARDLSNQNRLFKTDHFICTGESGPAWILVMPWCTRMQEVGDDEIGDADRYALLI